jgi:ABC-type nitrate/sulfonate/bicarbonate transport system ATPase subunit
LGCLTSANAQLGQTDMHQLSVDPYNMLNKENNNQLVLQEERLFTWLTIFVFWCADTWY